MAKTKTHNWTHTQVVERAARWLSNTIGCQVVITETPGPTNEIPDALGWKYHRGGRSYLVECKTSVEDFRAEKLKPCRIDSINALGAERWYMAPKGVIPPQELPPDWGLVEIDGRGAKVIVAARPVKDLRTTKGKENEMRFLILLLHRIGSRIAPVKLNTWLSWSNRLTPPGELQSWVGGEDQEGHNLELTGWTRCVNVLELPLNEVTEEPMCLACGIPFGECPCPSTTEEGWEFQSVYSEIWGRPNQELCGEGQKCGHGENSNFG